MTKSLLCRTQFHRARPCRISRLLRTRAEGRKAGQSRGGEHEKERYAHDQKPLARLLAGDNSPLRADQPDAISEVPGSRNQPDHIEQKEWRVKNFRLHLAERRARILMQINP